MRTFLTTLLILGLVATVGVFAAGMTGSTKLLGGTGDITVATPTTSASVTYTITSGSVTAASVTWTPLATGTYSVQAIIGSGSGSTTGVVIGAPDVGVSRATSVTISPSVLQASATSVTVVINQTA
jgi:uncharacterized protein (DUF2141 family)